MLRSVLVAAFSAVVTLGALGGFTGAKDDIRANSSWPSVAVDADTTDNSSWPVPGADGSGS
ncbi:hypothetical protein FNH04_18850 [Streptomyces phyllanthi]|uniref:Uncharacterized protein n=1 Tax=Streptomyces phyllanthi TaxID=1803180 RepID=A0A5N8W6E6_9ACTN|nr:hypothetical protein [Streptomyces phyllanthi]